jgi:chromosome partitioning protein
MPVIAVVNPKGGVGKSTLATHVAGHFAASGHAVMLGDVDRQQSARSWLGLRSESLAPIRSWEVSGSIVRPPKGVTHVVIDTPAQIGERRLAEVLKVADKVMVPLQPSIFDILATRDFVEQLRTQLGKPRQFESSVAIVGVRVDPRTRAAEQLRLFVEQLGVPVAGYLRDTQNYLHLAAHGMTLFDMPAHRVEQDLSTWAPIIAWLES